MKAPGPEWMDPRLRGDDGGVGGTAKEGRV